MTEYTPDELRDSTRAEKWYNKLLYKLFLRFIYPLSMKVHAGRVSTTALVNSIFTFCELYSGKTMFPYQEQFSKRVIRSVLENDGEEITALFSRQSGKSETISLTVGGMMIILPQLANMPMFSDDPRLKMFKDGMWVGIFAPSQRQAQITYGRIKTRIQSKPAQMILADPEFNLFFTTSNGQTVTLSNNSFATAISASDGSNIEGESFKLIILEECFVRGTPIRTKNGEVPIEEVNVGDKVYSFNHKTRKVELKVVENTMCKNHNGVIVHISTATGGEIVCTDNHRIYIVNRWEYVRADEVIAGDLVYSFDGNTLDTEVIETVVYERKEVEVFDLTVEDNHNFFANSLLVHNCQDISNFKITKCLTGDTRVLLSDGTYKRLDEVVQDECDTVVCYDKNMKELTSKTPTEFYDNGVQDVYKITLDTGDEIKATLNHFFYTYSQKTHGDKLKFRSVKQIQESLDKDRPLRIGVPDILPYFAPENYLDYEEGLILGYFLGDGCTVGTPKFIGDRETCERLHKLVQLVVDDDIRMNEYAFNPDNGMSEVNFSTPTNRKGSNTLRSMFAEYNILECTGADKKLPNKLYSREFYRGLVEGLIETDGSVEQSTKKPIISFANISKDLVLQLKDALLRFGIHSTISVTDNTQGIGGENARPLWLLHVKSSIDIERFASEFTLFKKQRFLNQAVRTVQGKETRERSKYYPDTMRFARVKSIEYAGKEHTYCLKVEGRNFIANGMISSNSIHPMGAAYNASIVKIGTATTHKGDFYDAIQRNKKRDAEKKSHIRNHFEYNCDVAAKYNPNYAKYVEKEKARMGENSDSFRMAYKLEWIIERGMFLDIEQFEPLCGEFTMERVHYDKTSTHVAGIDLGGKDDDTIVTMCEVNWSIPAILESRVDDETGEEQVYEAYNTYVKDWYSISNEPDYDVQYNMIMDYLNKWRLARIVCDATREASFAHRLRANRREEVIPYIFTTKSKSEIYKHLDKEISAGRARFCAGPETRASKDYNKFIEQLGDLQKGYSGQYMVVAHPDERGAHDDYPDSFALAVWGCSFQGEVSNTQTHDNLFRQQTPQEKQHYHGRNRVTARRRR